MLRALAAEMDLKLVLRPAAHRDLVALLRHMDYGLNTFAVGGNVAYSYKLNDYLLAGIPVINSLPGEAWEMVEGNDLGYNYAAGNGDELAAAMHHALEDPAAGGVAACSTALDFAAAHLDRTRTYAPSWTSCYAEPPGGRAPRCHEPLVQAARGRSTAVADPARRVDAQARTFRRRW